MITELAPGLQVERLNGTLPVIAPTDNWWESGVTFNSAALYLERSRQNDPLIRRLLDVETLDDPDVAEGVVALHYRSRPRHDPEYAYRRSFVGLALFTPRMKMLKRYAEPVMTPGSVPEEPDYLGIEDPRITRIGGDFYKVFCGASHFEPGESWFAQTSMAHSRDLIHWEKLGPVRGDINRVSNKDAVLFPETVNGSYVMLHRPTIGALSDMSIYVAASDSPTGDWTDCGLVLRAERNVNYEHSWIGAGSVPIPLADRRFLVIYHTGNFNYPTDRFYHLDAAVFDFRDFTRESPTVHVESRLDQFLIPQTPHEIGAPYEDSVANVVFTCGTYEFGDDLYIVYGGGDTYIMAARVNKSQLLRQLDQNRLRP